MSKAPRDKLKRPILISSMMAGRTPEERQVAWAQLAKLLASVRGNRLYLPQYPTWTAYVRGHWDRSVRWANKLIRDHGLSTAPSQIKYDEGVQIGRHLARVQRTRSYRAIGTGTFAAYVRMHYDHPAGWAYRRIAEYESQTMT